MRMTDIDIKIRLRGAFIAATATVRGIEVGHLKISVMKNEENENLYNWIITEWFVNKNFQRMGIGKNMIYSSVNALLEEKIIPVKLEYIWNGANDYVREWITKNFDARCECPIEILKSESGQDDWRCHLYELNLDKFLKYIQF